MAHYRKIDVRVWNDAKFVRLSNEAKLAFFALLTHPTLLAIGAMRGTLVGIAAETGIPGCGFDEVVAADMARFAVDSALVWLPNFMKYNPPENPNVVKAWVKNLDLLPECSMKNAVTDAMGSLLSTMPDSFQEPFATACGTPSATSDVQGAPDGLPNRSPNRSPKRMANQEQEQEQEQEKAEERSSRKRRTRSSLLPDRLRSRIEGTPLAPLGANGVSAAWIASVEQTEREYSWLDVPEELAAAARWLAANPDRAPKNLPAFVTRWLNRVIKRGLENGRPAARVFAARPD